MPDTIIDQFNPKQIKGMYRTVGLFIWVLLFSIAGFVYFLPFSRIEKVQLTLLLVISIPYSLYLYFGSARDLYKTPIVFYFTIAFSTLLIGWAHFILGPYHLHIEIFYPLTIIFLSVFGGWRAVWIITLVSIGVNFTVNTTLLDFRSTQYFIVQAFGAIGLTVIGVLSGFIGQTLQAFHSDTTRKNRSLAMLVEANRLLSPTRTLKEIFPRLASVVAEGLPATICRISLLDSTRTKLIDYGFYPIRGEDDTGSSPGETIPLDLLPKHQKVVQQKERILIHLENDPSPLTEEEQAYFLYPGVETLCIVPIQEDDKVIGLLSIGEERNKDREPFTSTKLELLNSLAKQISIAVQTNRLRRELEHQADRMAVLYDVGKAISRTIEIDDLLELIYQQLTRVLPSDAYFVALYKPDDNVLDLRMLIDNGKRFPPQEVPADEGLSSWIVKHHQPLLVKNLQEEVDSLPIDPIVVGEEKVTPSWLGVPMISDQRLIGILAVASYQAHAFDENDQHLLEQIAQQAALSIKNARHHMEVERRARLDSLTQVYNHGHFIHILHQEAQDALEEGKSLSLIMLDIDHFKQYNDTYGHVIGDQVLKLTVQAIQEHIKSTDSVGRWGGEEFGVALPGANVKEAEMVANRIRRTLSTFPLKDTEGNPIPKPTISQGIATLPTHTSNVDELIIIADRALYKAKSRGRDQFLIADRKQTPS